MMTPEKLEGKIRNVAKEKGLSSQEILQMYLFERVIDRLSKTRYRDNLILKGGFLIASMIGVDARTTMDMDTTVKGLSMNPAVGIPTGSCTARGKGVNYGPSGKETYYNLNMNGVVRIMRSMGNTDEYWVREDGCKMLGDYIMVAANLNIRPRGSIVETSLGDGIVCDTGGFAKRNPYQIDIATTW